MDHPSAASSGPSSGNSPSPPPGRSALAPSDTTSAPSPGLSFRFGMPHPVTRTVLLPGGLDEEGWQALVEELRAAFGGAGQEESWGATRSWRGDQVEAHLEPGSPPSGARVRILCHAVETMVLRIIGGILLLVGPGLLGLAAIGDEPTTAGWFVLSLGVILIVWSWLTFPRWRRRRETQLEEVVRATLSPHTDAASPDPGAPPHS